MNWSTNYLSREQVDESQHCLLAVALQTAAGGIPATHVGTGAGGSSSDLPWNDNDKDKFRRPKSKGSEIKHHHTLNDVGDVAEGRHDWKIDRGQHGISCYIDSYMSLE